MVTFDLGFGLAHFIGRAQLLRFVIAVNVVEGCDKLVGKLRRIISILLGNDRISIPGPQHPEAASICQP